MDEIFYSMLSAPSSVSTAALTLVAIQWEEGSLSLVHGLMISALIEPIPFSVDIEDEAQLQGNVDRWVWSIISCLPFLPLPYEIGWWWDGPSILYTFATSCNGDCSDVQKRSLVGFVGGIRLTSEEVVVTVRSDRGRDEMAFYFILF